MLCIRKILEYGRLYGFLLGLSQALVIFAYSIIAVLSIGWFADFIAKYQLWLRLISGLALLAFGVIIFFSKSAAIEKRTPSKKGFIADFFSIAGLMLIGPQTLLMFLALFAVLQLYEAATLLQHIAVVLAILLGSLLSWTLVCICFAGYKTVATQKVLTWINRSVGVLLVGFGVAVCLSAGFLRGSKCATCAQPIKLTLSRCDVIVV